MINLKRKKEIEKCYMGVLYILGAHKSLHLEYFVKVL